MTQNATTPHASMVLRECAICQSSIYPREETTSCPKCGLTFHAECWQQNFGCAAYGCEQVNVLAPPLPPAPIVELAPPPLPMERLPWDFLLLGAAAVALLLSMLSFGIPSALVGIAWCWRMLRVRGSANRIHRRSVAAMAGMLALIGVVLGVFVSRFWWPMLI